MRGIQTNFFFLDRDAEHTSGFERAKQDSARGSDPSDDSKNTGNLVAELFTAASVERTIVIGASFATIIVEHVLLLREEAGG